MIIMQAKKWNRYGKEVLCPINQVGRDYLAALGLKEFTRAAIDALHALGIEMEVI